MSLDVSYDSILGHDVQGTGTPVVLLHGLTAQSLARRYAAGHRADVEEVEHREPTLRHLVSPSRKAQNPSL